MNQIRIKGQQALAWHYLEDKTTTQVLYGGGAGGGKSFLGVLWHIMRRIKYPESRGMIGRAKLKNLEESTLQTFFKACQMLGYQQGVDFKYNSQKGRIAWANGSATILKDLFFYPSDPHYTGLGSTEYTDAFIDEVPEVTHRAVELVDTRIRWKLDDYGIQSKLLMTCNPTPGWVKDKWIEHEGLPIELPGHRKYVQALLKDNPDPGFRKIYQAKLENMESEYDKARLLYGDWDAEMTTENPFAHQFDPVYHVNPGAIFRPEIPITISIDFNLTPFAVTFGHCFEGLDGTYKDHTFDEAAIQDGSIPEMIDLIKKRYGPYLHGCTITGDSMGNNRDIAQRDNASYYIQIARGLGLSDHQVQVPHNPTHRNSRSDCNYILHQAKQPETRFQVWLHPENCKETIYDLKHVRCDNQGGIVKTKRSDPTQRADYLDTWRYRINYRWKKIILQHQEAEQSLTFT